MIQWQAASATGGADQHAMKTVIEKLLSLLRACKAGIYVSGDLQTT